MNIAPKGRSPAVRHNTLVSKYQGWLGIVVGTGLTFPGFLNGFFLMATKDPINTKGEEQQSQSSRSATMVEKGTAPMESSIMRKLLTRKKIEKANDGKNKAVERAVFSQFVSLNIL